MSILRKPLTRSDAPSCKVCAGRSRYVVSLESLHPPPMIDFFECRDCGLLFAGTEISEEQLIYAYGQLDPAGKYREIEDTSRQKMGRAVDDVWPVLEGRANPSVLDVGTGFALFLEVMKERHPEVSVTGHELPGDCADATAAKGIEVFTCPLEEVDRRFSLVSVIDVSNQILDPNALFRKCYDLTEEGGYLYVRSPFHCVWDDVFRNLLRVPGSEGLAKLWWQTRLSIFHLQQWNRDSLRRSIEQAGYELQWIRTFTELSWPIKRYTRMYLQQRRNVPAPLANAAAVAADLALVRSGGLKNKGIALARRR